MFSWQKNSYLHQFSLKFFCFLPFSFRYTNIDNGILTQFQFLLRYNHNKTCGYLKKNDSGHFVHSDTISGVFLWCDFYSNLSFHTETMDQKVCIELWRWFNIHYIVFMQVIYNNKIITLKKGRRWKRVRIGTEFPKRENMLEWSKRHQPTMRFTEI